MTNLNVRGIKTLHIRNLSANAIQLFINQLFGLAVFYLLSRYLSKENFGQLNWVLAVWLTGTSVISCGLDQLVLKLIATGNRTAFGTYLYHVLFSGISIYLLLVIIQIIAPNLTDFSLLLTIGAGKVLLYIATPIKQMLNGQEQFKTLAKTSIIASIGKGIGLLGLILFGKLTLPATAVIFMLSDALEFLVAMSIYKRQYAQWYSLNWDAAQYISLLKQASPQLGVVLFTSALARFDWIFIGAYLPMARLAEYSFAYKAFEISTFPLLAIAPLLVPRFTKIIKEQEHLPGRYFDLLKSELLLASGIGILMYLYWTPLVDLITHHQYGLVNSPVILVFALCMPFMYYNNFLWSIGFAQGKLKLMFWVFAASFTVNIAGDIIFIPIYQNQGAAVAYLLAMIAQAVLFAICIEHRYAVKKAGTMLLYIFYAISSGCLAQKLCGSVILSPLLAVVFYLLLTQLNSSVIQLPKKMLSRIKYKFS